MQPAKPDLTKMHWKDRAKARTDYYAAMRQWEADAELGRLLRETQSQLSNRISRLVLTIDNEAGVRVAIIETKKPFITKFRGNGSIASALREAHAYYTGGEGLQEAGKEGCEG